MPLRSRRSACSTIVAPMIALLIASTIAPRPAFAASDKDMATDLFDKGLAKMEAGKCDQQPITDEAACKEARESFRRAYEIYPAGLGALRNLAYVERGLHLYASSARRFRELERRAPTDPNPKRHVWAEFARKELLIIEPLVPHLTVKVPSERPPGMTIALDGEQLPPAVWDTSIDVDPGQHELRAEATGRAPFVTSFSLAEKEAKDVAIVFKTIEAPPPPPPPPPMRDTSGSTRIVPLVVAGTGLVVTGVGLVIGLGAINKRKDACGDSKFCEPVKLEEARSSARTSNLVTGIGATLLVGGVVWYLLTPGTPDSSTSTTTTGVRVVPVAGFDFGGVAAVGRF